MAFIKKPEPEFPLLLLQRRYGELNQLFQLLRRLAVAAVYAHAVQAIHQHFRCKFGAHTLLNLAILVGLLQARQKGLADGGEGATNDLAHFLVVIDALTDRIDQQTAHAAVLIGYIENRLIEIGFDSLPGTQF